MSFICYLILPISIFTLWSYLLQPMPNKFPTNEKPQVQLIDSNIMIWYGDHALKHTGWAERPVLQFESRDHPESLVDITKLKKWDTYIIMNNELLLEISLMDYAYTQIAYIKVIDLKLGIVISENEETNSQLIQSLNDESIHYRGTINVLGQDIQMKLANTQKSTSRPTYKNITLSSKGINASINMIRPVALRDIVVYQPINSQKTKFVYLTKGYNIPAKGEVQINDKVFKMKENETTSGYCLGRGIFYQQTAWVWIHGNGKRYGINLGGGIQLPEGSNSTEDAFFVDDDIIKLKSAEIYEYYDSDSKEWVFRTKEFKEIGDFEIYFQPKKKLKFQKNFQYNLVYFTNTKQFIGEIKGKVKDKNKDVRTFKNIQAYAEIFKARW